MSTESLVEKDNFLYEFDVVDELGAAVPAASFDAVTLTLYNVASGAIVNSRDGQNVLNAHDVTIDSSGHVAWAGRPADAAIVDSSRAMERRRAVFIFSWGSGAKQHTHTVDFLISNEPKVT